MRRLFLLIFLLHAIRIFGADVASGDKSALGLSDYNPSPLSDEETIKWLEKIVDGEAITAVNDQKGEYWRPHFLFNWGIYSWTAVRDLTKDKGHLAVRAAITGLVKEVINRTSSDSSCWGGCVFQEVANDQLDANAVTPTSQNDVMKQEAEYEIEFYQRKLGALLPDKDLDALDKSYQYVGRFRNFGRRSYVEVDFIRNKETNEILTAKKLIGADPDSAEFCIAEILRNQLFLRKMNLNAINKKDKLTDNPLSLRNKEWFGDHSWNNESYVQTEISALLKEYFAAPNPAQ